MRKKLRHIVRPTALTACLLLPVPMTAAAAADAECEPAGGYAFVCGPQNPEDLVLVPGTKWILSSSLSAPGGIYLVDAGRKTWVVLYPGDTPRAHQDMELYGACPGAPDPTAFVTHGLNLQPDADGRSTLYVVGHGGREAIEVFDVEASGDEPALTWIGCVLTPEGLAANSVAVLGDGSLLATVPLRAGVEIGASLGGEATGQVYAWSPGDAGFVPVQGTEMPYANGIEVSADGAEFYVASSGLQNVTAFSNTNPARVLRRTEPFGFVPDNLHWDDKGRLITAGLNLDDPACGDLRKAEVFDFEAFMTCPRAFTVWSVDPQSMQGRALATGPANPAFSNITMALEVGGDLWIGTFHGDRIAYRKSQPEVGDRLPGGGNSR